MIIDMQEIEFIKMHGCGNDFVLIDNIKQNLNLTNEQIGFLSDRRKSIGFDQLIVVDKNNKDINIRFYNSDGSMASACGNGSRCAAHYFFIKEGLEIVNFITPSKRINVKKINEKNYAVDLGEAKILDQNLNNTKVNIGNNHLIIFLDNLNDDVFYKTVVELSKQADGKVFNKDINISVAQIISCDKIHSKTWESGTGPTLSCGTGASATVFAALKKGLVNNRVEVTQDGGVLEIEISEEDNVTLTGPAEISYIGKVKI
jgi:diaminopimelate epimerase